MKLFRVTQHGFGVQDLEVFSSGRLDDQLFLVEEANQLLAIDMIEDFAGKKIRYAGETRGHSFEVEALIKRWD